MRVRALSLNKWFMWFVILNIADVALTLSLGTGFGKFTLKELNPIGIYGIILLKFGIISLVWCLSFYKPVIVKWACLIMGVVVLAWIIVGGFELWLVSRGLWIYFE